MTCRLPVCGFTVYGLYGRVDMAPFIFIDKIYNGEPLMVFGGGSAVHDFTYVDDIVNGVIKQVRSDIV